MLILTTQALYELDNRPDSQPRQIDTGREVRCIAAGETLHLLAGPDGQVQVRYLNAARQETVGQIDRTIESLLILREDPLECLLGTEEARLFRLTPAGIERVETFDELDCREGWHTPWGGPPAVRSLAATTDGWVYADIHVGSIMRSPDWGQTWQPVSPTLHEDVHQVATCPLVADWVYANTAHSVYLSEDRGKTWRDCGEPLDHRYGRAVAVCHDRPKLVLASTSDGPHGQNVHGQLFRSDDAGYHWEPVDQGFPPSTRKNINTGHVAFTDNGLAWACQGNELYVGEDLARRWSTCWQADSEIVMLSTKKPRG